MKTPDFVKKQICSPAAGSKWAGKMVLNPAMIADKDDPDTFYMLFRATGPCPEARIEGKPMPYPIFIGYAVSHDRGMNWDFDFSRPALPLALKYGREEIYTVNAKGEKVFNYANGGTEDPRLFYFEDELYLTVAARTFPPGPYWDHDDPVQCMPDWVKDSNFGRAVKENYTVTLLYKVDIDALKNKDYENAFALITPLHDPDTSDDRDVMLFPRRIEINGRKKIVCIHRPKFPWQYEIGKELTAPSMFIACADNLEDFADNSKVERIVFAVPEFEWEANRIGASFPPIELGNGEWLLPYHGKQDDIVGYTQSFMLLRENGMLKMDILSRPAERLLFADEPWELEGEFTIPCLFSCSGICHPDGKLYMGYGAADKKIGMVSVDFQELLTYIKEK